MSTQLIAQDPIEISTPNSTGARPTSAQLLWFSRLCLVLGLLAVGGRFVYSVSDGLFAPSDESTKLVPDQIVGVSEYPSFSPIYDIALSPQSDLLYYRDYQGLLAQLNLNATIENDRVTRLYDDQICDQLLASPRRDVLALAFREGSLALHFPDEPQKNRVVDRGPKSAINCLAFSRDGKWIAEGGIDGMIRIHAVDASFGTVSIRRPAAPITAVAFGSNGELFVSTEQQIEQWRWNPKRPGATKLVQSFPQLENAREIIVTHDRRFLILGALNGHLQCWNLRENRMQWEAPPLSPTCRGLCISPDRQLVTASRGYNLLELFNIETGASEVQFESEMKFVTGSVFTRKGDLLYTSSTDGAIHIWSMETQSVRGIIEPIAMR